MNRLMSLLFILFICVISLKSYPGNSNYVQGQLIVRLYNDNDLPNLLEEFHFIRLQLVKILTRRLHTYLRWINPWTKNTSCTRSLTFRITPLRPAQSIRLP